MATRGGKVIRWWGDLLALAVALRIVMYNNNCGNNTGNHMILKSFVLAWQTNAYCYHRHCRCCFCCCLQSLTRCQSRNGSYGIMLATAQCFNARTRTLLFNDLISHSSKWKIKMNLFSSSSSCIRGFLLNILNAHSSSKLARSLVMWGSWFL